MICNSLPHLQTIRIRYMANCAAMCAVIIFVGCGETKQVLKDRAEVSGTVTFNGKPLPAGSIGFESTERYGRSPASIIDGKFKTDRAPIGKVIVSIQTSSVQFGAPNLYVPIPAKYEDSSTSGLTAEIKPGVNENLNFDLKP